MPVEIWITNVDHDDDRRVIKQVCAWRRNENNLVGKRSYSREELLRMLQYAIPYEADGQPRAEFVNTVFTASTSDGTNYRILAKVEVTGDGRHLTTEGTPTTQDSLGELPPCDCTRTGSPDVGFVVES